MGGVPDTVGVTVAVAGVPDTVGVIVAVAVARVPVLVAVDGSGDRGRNGRRRGDRRRQRLLQQEADHRIQQLQLGR